MRKISDALRLHNGGPRPRRLPAALMVLAALTGCGGEGTPRRDATPASAGAATATDCPVAVDLSGWEAFQALAARLAAGEAVPGDELAAYADLPAVAAWRASLAPNVPAPLRVANWLEDAFWAELGRTDGRKQNADRRAFSASYRWSWDQRARVDSLAAELVAADGRCGILARARGWIAPERLPDPVPVAVVPAKPELRYHEGRVFVDTGVLGAGSTAQLQRQIASLLYRNLQAEDGPNPLAAQGDTAVAATFRIVRNEGVAAWIEQLPATHFADDHPRLRQVRPVPEHFYESTQRLITLCANGLPRLCADPALMTERGQDFARSAAAGGGLNQGGYGMAALIAARLGEDRLQEAARSVPAFLAAYQEAALANGDPVPALGTPGTEPWQCLAPLPAEVYARLLALLERLCAPTP